LAQAFLRGFRPAYTDHPPLPTRDDQRGIAMIMRFAAFSLLLATIADPTVAHHSATAQFDPGQRISRTGVLREVDWRNPHIYLYVEIENESGEVETWSFEGPSPNAFRPRETGAPGAGLAPRGNFKRGDFEASIGETVSIIAHQARDGSNSGLIHELTLANGDVVFIGGIV
jgi:hypothetical protein